MARRRKPIALFLALLMCLSLMQAGALADSEAQEDAIEEIVSLAADESESETEDESMPASIEDSAEAVDPVEDEDSPAEAPDEPVPEDESDVPEADEPALFDEAEEPVAGAEEDPAADGAAAPAPITTSAESGYSYAVVGNTGAVITMDSAVTSAASSDTGVAAVSYDGKVVTVTGVSGAVGVATVTVKAGGATYAIDVPIGYTTFVFQGDSVRVYKGSGGFDVTGVTASGTEYAVTGTENDDGSTSYSNTADYSVCVELKEAGGTYVFAGLSSDMAISVKKQATGPAVMLLAGLDLASSFTSPVTIKKKSTSTVTITALRGHTNTLTDAACNNADDNADNELAESAVIKAKSNARLTLNGAGTLNVVCSTKNAVKVGAGGSLTVEELTLNVTSAKNGLSSDNLLTINSGTITVTAAADGIRTDPDEGDTASTGDIVINGGAITIRAGSDGIQAVHDLTINGGAFDIRTLGGCGDKTFDADTMSGKGLKASTTDEYAVENATNTITITGGTFTLDCADDAIHSDGYIVITGGTFDIYTGDDGAHADTSLTLGEEGGSDSAIRLTVYASYEGLEAGNVYIYSGTYNVTASDDGVNAAGDSSSGDNFNPGGGPGGRPGQGGGTSISNYAITINGGHVTVHSAGDGLDANGPLKLLGGTIVVWGPSNENEALDADGGVTFGGATVLAADAGTMHSSSFSGKYITYSSTGQGGTRPGQGSSSSGSIKSGTTITVLYNGKAVFQRVAPQSVSYMWFSSPDMTSTFGWSFSTTYTGTVACESHTWSNGVCTVCGALYGDADGDGTITVRDAARILAGADSTLGGYDAAVILQKTVNP